MKTGDSRIGKFKAWCGRVWEYCSRGVWADTRSDWRIGLIKTLNLSVSSFLNADLQSRAAALTYRTLLAIVPALAMVFAICRGFGFHNLLQSQIFSHFPSQRGAFEQAFSFVDSYLAHASEGVFVGIGIVFLLWTLISLVGSVEESFNVVWGVKKGRSLWRKVTDYTAIFLILPVLMICSSGLSIFMSSTLQNAITFEFLSPVYPVLLDVAKYVLTWLFFAGVYMLVPNTKVKFKNAFVSGVISGTAFLILQWLFVSGQMYVSKYNAIYGSFSFLPLLLIWLQFVWVICLSGAVICYSSQNIFRFSFSSEIKNISVDYRRKVTVAIMAIIVKRFVNRRSPMKVTDFVRDYDMPTRLVGDIVEELIDAKFLSRVVDENNEGELAVQPAMDVNGLTVGHLLKTLDEHGASRFIPFFDNRFASVSKIVDEVSKKMIDGTNDMPITDIVIEKDINSNKKI